MKSSALSGLAAVALFAGLSVQHTAILPPFPDKALKANTSEAPAGCKYLPSDKGWPSDDVWKANFPGVFKKLRGTVGPDWMVQAQSVADVQKAVNFAREHNVRLTVITTGHDFHARETARSGLRIDLATLKEPTVFATTWKCGDVLKPATKSGRVVDEFHACKVPNYKRQLSTAIPQRNAEYQYFEKRGNSTCDSIMKLRKRQGMGPDEGSHMGMGMGDEVPPHNTIKVEPGKHAYARIPAAMYNEQFYTQADKSGLMTVGAQHGGVGVVGGWMQAGGHNPFSHKFGMQVDNVVEIEVVTPDGKFQKASECSNPELFWALRGGGGSTFGIVTAATVKVHPTFPVAVTRFYVNSTSKIGVLKATSYFLQEGAKLRDKYGLQGYFYVYPGSFQSALHMPDNFATLENAKAVTEPLMKKMEELAGSTKHIEPVYYQYKTYREWYNGEYGNETMEDLGLQFLSWNDGSDGLVPSEAQAMANPISVIPYEIEFPQYPMKKKRSLTARAVRPVFSRALKAAVRTMNQLSRRNMETANMGTTQMRSQPNPMHYLDSRLLSDKHVNSVSIDTLAEAINGTMPAVPGIHIRGFLIGGGNQAKPDKAAMGLLPAWRDMTWHFITNAVPGNVRHDYGIDTLAKLFPDAGAYVNEASPINGDWKRAYWGDNYPKLEAIKRKVDPNNVLWCTPCVGGDQFTYDDERICRNPSYAQSPSNLTTGFKPAFSTPPSTYPNMQSKTGIASLPGGPGIPHPIIGIVTDYMGGKKLPDKMLKSNYFKIAMGEGGSALGKYADNDPWNEGKKLEDWPLKW